MSSNEDADEWTDDNDWLTVGPHDDQGPWSHQVMFDDWIAHLHEDLVERYVDHVRTVPGVLEVLWQDREVVILQAPGVAYRDLGLDAQAWFAQHDLENPC